MYCNPYKGIIFGGLSTRFKALQHFPLGRFGNSVWAWQAWATRSMFSPDRLWHGQHGASRCFYFMSAFTDKSWTHCFGMHLASPWPSCCTEFFLRFTAGLLEIPPPPMLTLLLRSNRIVFFRGEHLLLCFWNAGANWPVQMERDAVRQHSDLSLWSLYIYIYIYTYYIYIYIHHYSPSSPVYPVIFRMKQSKQSSYSELK